MTELEAQVRRLIEAEKRDWRHDMLSWQYLAHCQEKTAQAALELILEEVLGVQVPVREEDVALPEMALPQVR